MIIKIKISPESLTISPNSTQKLEVFGTYQDGSVINVTPGVRWSSSNAGIVHVSNDKKNAGLLTSYNPGSAIITAKFGQLIANLAVSVKEKELQFKAPPKQEIILTSIEISSPSTTPVLGGTIQLNAVGTFSDGTSHDITNLATWTSSNTNVASINNASQDPSSPSGLLKTVGVGLAVISVGLNGVFKQLNIEVKEPVVISLDITPESSTTYQGSTALLQAWANYSDGSFRNITSIVKWTASNKNVAIEDVNEINILIRCNKTGNSSISARVDGFVALASLEIQQNPLQNDEQFYSSYNNENYVLENAPLLFRTSPPPPPDPIYGVEANLEDYVLTVHESKSNVFEVPVRQFNRVIAAHETTEITDSFSLGFSLKLGERVYNAFAVTRYGSIILGEEGDDLSDSYLDLATPINDEKFAYSSLMNSGGDKIVLSPWTAKLSPVANDVAGVESLAGAGIFSNVNKSYYNNNLLDEIGGGVFIKINDVHPVLGTRTLIRWKCHEGPLAPTTLAKTTEFIKWYNEELSNEEKINSNIPTFEFECRIYATGKIEFCYSPSFLGGSNSETCSAVILWPPKVGDATPHDLFRDISAYFSSGDGRNISNLGGAEYDVSYTVENDDNVSLDPGKTETYFNSALSFDANWPSKAGTFTIVTFQPGAVEKRKVLPRKEIKKRSSISVSNDSFNPVFNDKKSIAFVTQNVSFPTRLPRFSGVNDASKQDLFGGGIFLNAKVDALAIEQWAFDEQETLYPAFSEVKQFEQSNINDFFLTGTSELDVGLGYNQPLTEKDQIFFNLPINAKTELLSTCSCIYYYDTVESKFSIVAPYDVTRLDDGVTELELAHPIDHKLFGPIGNHIMRFNDSTTAASNIKDFNQKNFMDCLTVDNVLAIEGGNKQPYELSSSYNSTNQINSVVKSPFLIEKIVLELPIEAGEGWFNDVTRTGERFWTSATPTIDRGNMDFGGPAFVISLIAEKNVVGQLQSTTGTSKRREIIARGLVTHNFDVITGSQKPVSSSATFDGAGTISRYSVFNQGIGAFNVTPDCVITASNIGQLNFTGSIILEMQVKAGNGGVVGFYGNYDGDVGTGATTSTPEFGASKMLLEDKTIDLGSNQVDSGFGNYKSQLNSIVSSKPFGKSSLGMNFFFTNGSGLGRGFATGKFIASASIDNSFYSVGNSEIEEEINKISNPNPNPGWDIELQDVDVIGTLMNSVWALNSNEFWAVGRSHLFGGTNRAIYKWDGTSWSSAATVDNSLDNFKSVHGTSSNNVWVGGHIIPVATTIGAIKQWNGSSWTNYYSNAAPLSALGNIPTINGVWTTSTTLWAVTDAYLSPGEPFIEYGKVIYKNAVGSWQILDETTVANIDLNAVWGIDDDDVWVVGDSGTIRHYVNKVYVAPPGASTIRNMNAIYGFAHDDIWFVGNNGTILRWDGSALVTQPSPTGNTLRAVWGTSSNDIFVAGTNVFYHYDGSTWSVVDYEASATGTDYFNGIDGLSTGEARAVGINFISLGSGQISTIWHREAPSDGTEAVYFRTVFNNESDIVSPHIINPGEKLIVAISKTRPVYLEDVDGNLNFNSEHDVKISTGSLNVRLYGTYLDNRGNR